MYQHNFNRGAPSSHAIGAPKLRKRGYLSTREILVFTWMYVRPSTPQGNQSEISHFLASVEACNLILHIHIVVNWQLSKQLIRWLVSHVCIAGDLLYQVSTHLGNVFFNIFSDKLLVFNWSQVQLQEDFFPLVTNLLFEVDYKFINANFAFSLG